VSCLTLDQTPCWRIIPCWLSAIACSIHSQSPFISGCHLLHPQPEDTPRRGYIDPLIMAWDTHSSFKRLEILPLQSQYILPVLLFVVKNKDLYTTNQEIHRSNINLHPPVCNLTVFQKGVYFSSIKLLNHLPLNIKSLSNEIKSSKPANKVS